MASGKQSGGGRTGEPMTATVPPPGAEHLDDIVLDEIGSRRGTRSLLSRISPSVAFAVLAGIVATVLVYGVLRSSDERVEVAVAAVDLRAGQRLTAADVGTALINAENALLATLVSPESLRSFDGYLVAADLPAGTLIPRTLLLAPTTDARSRVMTIPLAAERAVGGDLHAGDRVDVLAVCDRRGYLLYADLPVVGAAAGGSLAAGYTLGVEVDQESAVVLAEAITAAELFAVKATGADAGTGHSAVAAFRECLHAARSAAAGGAELTGSPGVGP